MRLLILRSLFLRPLATGWQGPAEPGQAVHGRGRRPELPAGHSGHFAGAGYHDSLPGGRGRPQVHICCPERMLGLCDAWPLSLALGSLGNGTALSVGRLPGPLFNQQLSSLCPSCSPWAGGGMPCRAAQEQRSGPAASRERTPRCALSGSIVTFPGAPGTLCLSSLPPSRPAGGPQSADHLRPRLCLPHGQGQERTQRATGGGYHGGRRRRCPAGPVLAAPQLTSRAQW